MYFPAVAPPEAYAVFGFNKIVMPDAAVEAAVVRKSLRLGAFSSLEYNLVDCCECAPLNLCGVEKARQLLAAKLRIIADTFISILCRRCRNRDGCRCLDMK